MGRTVIVILAIAAILVGLLQLTPLRFLSPDATDFVWGLALGLAIGAGIAIIATRAGTGK